MAGKKTTPTFASRPEYKGFLEYKLSDVELEECDGWHEKDEEIWEYVHALIENNYDVSLSYSHKSKLTTVTLKDQSPTRKTAGYYLSAQDESATAAIKLAIWKHFKVLEQDWTRLLDQPVKARRG